MPFVFSDAMTIPTGVLLVALMAPIPRYKAIYENPDEFDGFRFSRLRGKLDGQTTKYQASRPSLDFIQFGYGPHSR
jgi:cytochrome P450